MPLLERADSLLVVVDAQPGFYRPRSPAELVGAEPGTPGTVATPDRAALDAAALGAAALDAATLDAAALDIALERLAWLAGVATALEVPVMITEEAAERNGGTDERILASVRPGTPVLSKVVFGLADDPPVAAAVAAAGRGTIVLAGTETDVCVTHSALGLLERGFRVVVVPDASHAPGALHGLGLARLAAAGVELIHAKGVYYDWVRTLAAALAFERAHPDLASPPGFSI